MPRREDPHTVVIDQEDLQPTIQSNGLQDVIHNLHPRQQGNYSSPEKGPRLKGNISNENKDDDLVETEGNYSCPEKGPRLKGNIASENRDDDLVETDNLMMKWEEILKAGYNFDKGTNLK